MLFSTKALVLSSKKPWHPPHIGVTTFKEDPQKQSLARLKLKFRREWPHPKHPKPGWEIFCTGSRTYFPVCKCSCDWRSWSGGTRRLPDLTTAAERRWSPCPCRVSRRSRRSPWPTGWAATAWGNPPPSPGLRSKGRTKTWKVTKFFLKFIFLITVLSGKKKSSLTFNIIMRRVYLNQYFVNGVKIYFLNKNNLQYQNIF